MKQSPGSLAQLLALCLTMRLSSYMKRKFCVQVLGTANSEASTITAALRQVKGLISLLKSRMTEFAACDKVCQHSFPIGR